MSPEEQVLTIARRLVDHGCRMRVAVRETADWAQADTVLYDPIADRYSLQLPGELIRRLRGLADENPSTTEDRGGI